MFCTEFAFLYFLSELRNVTHRDAFFGARLAISVPGWFVSGLRFLLEGGTDQVGTEGLEGSEPCVMV